jgi:hypothetical protein
MHHASAHDPRGTESVQQRVLTHPVVGSVRPLEFGIPYISAEGFPTQTKWGSKASITLHFSHRFPYKSKQGIQVSIENCGVPRETALVWRVHLAVYRISIFKLVWDLHLRCYCFEEYLVD